MIRAALAVLLVLPLAALAAGGEAKLERANVDPTDVVSIQRGVKVFMNYCLNCHSATSMRYNRLTDLGLSEQQIQDNLLFATQKVGDTMSVAMRRSDARQWFGVEPPDLSVIARSRGADWLYTYLRTFYRDGTRPTGWNNLAFPDVGMPHALWQLQGIQDLQVEKTKDAAGHEVEVKKLVLAQPGSMKPEQYDAAVADLVSFLVYIGEPAAATRKQLGIWVLIGLGILFVLSFALKKNYWKDVH
jgi:ubiquinol-cytochrome c reductase cytochrome c1 subunit